MTRSIIVTGMAFGDEGKGSVVDWMCRKYDAKLVVRFGGGPQCAHNVVLADGTHHCHSQFGSGTLAGARTFLSKYMLIDPFALDVEAYILKGKGVPDPLSLLTIDPECVIVTPYHRLANQLREVARGADRHGSVGLGIGEARADQLAGFAYRAGDPVSLLAEIQERKIEQMRPLADAEPNLFAALQEIQPAHRVNLYDGLLRRMRLAPWGSSDLDAETVVFEGHQGVLLDEALGFAPYHTWADCTPRNARQLIYSAWSPARERLSVGVFRSYFTRHGPGPFPTETHELQVAERHNGAHPHMGPFRTGYFDAQLAKYAVDSVRDVVDCLAITHMDRRSDIVCDRYADWDGTFTTEAMRTALPMTSVWKRFRENLQDFVDKPVQFMSHGPTAKDKREMTAVKEVTA